MDLALNNLQRLICHKPKQPTNPYYNYRMSDTSNNNNNIRNNNYKNKNRYRKIIWFNPPLCKVININIGKYFLNLIDKHFKKNYPLNKIFNRNTLKIYYSCTNNISKIIHSHNKRLLANLNW